MNNPSKKVSIKACENSVIPAFIIHMLCVVLYSPIERVKICKCSISMIAALFLATIGISPYIVKQRH